MIVCDPDRIVTPFRRLLVTEAMYLAMERVAETKHEYRDGAGDTLELRSLGITLEVDAIYEGAFALRADEEQP